MVGIFQPDMSVFRGCHLEVVVSQLHRRGERLGPLGLKNKDPAGSGVNCTTQNRAVYLVISLSF